MSFKVVQAALILIVIIIIGSPSFPSNFLAPDRLYSRPCIFLFVCIYTYVYIYIYAYYTCMYVHVYICTYTYIYIYMYIWKLDICVYVMVWNWCLWCIAYCPSPLQVNPVTEGQGGWGAIGSTPSDNYINQWETTIFNQMGPCYEIFSAFIQSSEELKLINPALVRTA